MKEKVEIEKVYTRKKDGVVPTLVKFQNGKLTSFKEENTHFCRLRSRKDRNVLGALLVTKGNMYQGIINDTEANELTDTYICVRNKVTNMMTMIPTDQVTLKNTIYQKIDRVQRDALSDRVRRTTLFKKFGGRKESRLVHDQEKMRMDINIVQEQLKATVEETSVVENEIQEKLDNPEYFDKIRPPMNAEAKEVSEIYQISDVIPQNLLNRLDQEAKTVYQTQLDQIPIKSEYLKKHIEAIQKSTASPESLLRLKMILYMDSLLNLLQSRVKSLKKAELSEVSEKIEKTIRDLYSDPKARFIGCRTNFSNEKAICHFIVLALLLEDKFQIDGLVLSQELNTTCAKVKRYAHIVQAMPKPRTSILVLKLPKDVPPVPTGQRRRKN